MLQKLLDEIQSGSTLEPGVLAARLGTSPQMVVGMLEHLERMGMLQAFSACSSQGCEGCDLACSSTHAAVPARIWKLK
jgi:DNA-binding Lrp family transcriptional regulator